MAGRGFTHNCEQVARALEQRGEQAIAEIDRALGRGALEVAREGVRIMPKFRSETARATGTEQEAPMHWLVRFGGGHALFTEEGTNAGGMPPLAEMLDWIRLKGIIPRDPTMSAEGLARVMQRSIAAYGVPAQPFAAPALDNMRPRLIDLVRQAAEGAMAGAPA